MLLLLALGVPVALTQTAVAADPVSLNVLIMSDTAYSDSDVSSMTAAFNQANPEINAKVDFVPYAGLRVSACISAPGR